MNKKLLQDPRERAWKIGILEEQLSWLGFAERIERIYEAREFLDYDKFVDFIKQVIDDKKNGKLKNFKKKCPVERKRMIEEAIEAFVQFSEEMNYEEALEQAGKKIGRSGKSVEAYVRDHKEYVKELKMIRDEEAKLRSNPEAHKDDLKRQKEIEKEAYKRLRMFLAARGSDVNGASDPNVSNPTLITKKIFR